MTNEQLDPKSAKAELKAAKARSKAMRPWFKKKRYIFPILLVVVIGGSIAMNGNKSTNTNTGANGSTSTESSSASTSPEALMIGDKAVDGKFTFTVTSKKCGIKRVGNSTFGADAQGQFCEVAISIENTGTEAQTMFADSQKLFDDQGREFSADTASMIYMDSGSNVWLKEINPGNKLDGILLFDVPANAKLDRIELHDSAFSDGIVVSLK